MNGKKAKLMRQVGKGLTKSDKRLYNMLNHVERGILANMYQTLIDNNKEVMKKQRRQARSEPRLFETNPAGNRKTRRFNAAMTQRSTRDARIAARNKKINEYFLSRQRS